MMTSSNGKKIPRYWPYVWGIHRSPVNSPHKGQWHGTLMSSLTYAWTNSWVNNRDSGDLRRHRTHYGVTVMARNRIKRSRHEDTFAIRFLSTANRWSNLYDKILIDSEWMIWFLGLGYNLSICIRLFRLFTQPFVQAQKTSKLCVTNLCERNSPVNPWHKGPETRKCFHVMTSSRYSGTPWRAYRVCHMGCFILNHRDHSMYGLTQWETTLHCNAVSHWQSPYPEWSLTYQQFYRIPFIDPVGKNTTDINYSQRTHYVRITSLLRQNDVTTASFWRDDDVINTSCVPWVISKQGLSVNTTSTDALAPY